MARKKYQDDDGRTVADMSGFAPRTPLGYLSPAGRRKKDTEDGRPDTDRPWEQSGMSREDRRGFIWGALSAALLIALAFIAGLGLLIALIVLFFA